MQGDSFFSIFKRPLVKALLIMVIIKVIAMMTIRYTVFDKVDVNRIDIYTSSKVSD